MSTKKITKSELILERIKAAFNIKLDVELARFLGVNPTTLSNWKKRNSVDYELIFSKCERVDKDWLLTGYESNVAQTDKQAVTGESEEYLVPTGTGGGFHVKKEHQYSDEEEKPIHQLLESSGVLNIGNMINRVRRDGSAGQNKRLDNASDEFVREVLSILDEIKGKDGKQKKTAG